MRKQQNGTYEEALSEVRRLFAVERLSVTGFNEEKEYFWGRNETPSTRRCILKIER